MKLRDLTAIVEDGPLPPKLHNAMVGWLADGSKRNEQRLVAFLAEHEGYDRILAQLVVSLHKAEKTLS